jgi:crossover junction endodeoxyribonuclease RuvC
LIRAGRRPGSRQGAEAVLVLGVDPGSVRTGWALVEGTAATPVMIGADIIALPRNLSFPLRLAALGEQFEKILDLQHPDVAVVESPFHGINARSALQLAHARGVILAALGQRGIPVEEYSPATIKKTVTGSGRADKDQVRRMVQAVLAVPLKAGQSDLSDALAAAYCHLAHGSLRAAIERSGT